MRHADAAVVVAVVVAGVDANRRLPRLLLPQRSKDRFPCCPMDRTQKVLTTAKQMPHQKTML
jgi:hypothetical protein